MKKIILTLALCIAPSVFAQNTFFCSGLCGFIGGRSDALQGVNLVQVMATGGDAPTGLANLQKACQAIADKNPDVRISLYGGFNITTSGDAGNLEGAGYPATQELSCIAL